MTPLSVRTGAFSFCNTCMMDGKVRNRSGTALMRLPDRRVGEAFLDAE